MPRSRTRRALIVAVALAAALALQRKLLLQSKPEQDWRNPKFLTDSAASGKMDHLGAPVGEAHTIKFAHAANSVAELTAAIADNSVNFIEVLYLRSFAATPATDTADAPQHAGPSHLATPRPRAPPTNWSVADLTTAHHVVPAQLDVMMGRDGYPLLAHPPERTSDLDVKVSDIAWKEVPTTTPYTTRRT